MINRLKTLMIMIAAALVFSAGSSVAAENSGQGANLLLATYRDNLNRLENNSFGIPLFLESYEKASRVHVDVYGIFDYPFNSVVSVLMVPANWCDIVPLHLNVKACTYKDLPDYSLLTFYVGRKVYQPSEETRQVIYRYRKVDQQLGYLDINLTADAGPFGTKDHKMRFEALPLKGGRTFVHVSYEYSDSAALRLAAKIYFATVGRGKVGFTVTGADESGTSKLIGGPRGSIERNAVRYYFAIQAYMNSLRYAEDKRFTMSISDWYDLTIRYRKQLYDLEKKDYLAFKINEHRNQLKLQRHIGKGLM